jgi:hypothetical protein
MPEDIDVQSVETPTADSSPQQPSPEQSSPETSETDTQQVQEQPLEQPKRQPVKAVPYDRFAKVNEEAKRLREEVERYKQSAPLDNNPELKKEQVKRELDGLLKELGYVSKQELEDKEYDKQLEHHIETLERKYNGQDGRPKFDRSKVIEYASQKVIGDLEVAYEQMYKAELMDVAIKQALGKTKPMMGEESDGSGSSQVGTTQDDLKKAAFSGDRDALRTLIKRTIL